MVRLFVEKGADVNAKDADIRTPLSVAAKKGDIEIVKLLLNHGARK